MSPPTPTAGSPSPASDEDEGSRVRRRAQELFTGTRGHLVFVVLLVAIVGLEAVGLNQLATTLPAVVSPENARLALQSVISVAGVLMGFTGLLFGALLARESVRGRTFSLLVAMVVTVVMYLLSVLNAFYAILLVGGPGLTSTVLMAPVGFLVYGTSILFFGIAVYMIRS
jgi:hypothetical protein